MLLGFGEQTELVSREYIMESLLPRELFLTSSFGLRVGRFVQVSEHILFDLVPAHSRAGVCASDDAYEDKGSYDGR